MTYNEEGRVSSEADESLRQMPVAHRKGRHPRHPVPDRQPFRPSFGMHRESKEARREDHSPHPRPGDPQGRSTRDYFEEGKDQAQTGRRDAPKELRRYYRS